MAEFHAAAPEPGVHHIDFGLFLGAAHAAAAPASVHAHDAAVPVGVRVLVEVRHLFFFLLFNEGATCTEVESEKDAWRLRRGENA